MPLKSLNLGTGRLFGLFITLLAGIAVESVNGNAQDQPIKRTELLRFDVAGAAGKESVVYIADAMPGAVGGKHTHYGDEVVYILDGTLIVEPEGKAPITLKQGETAHLTSDVVHSAKNGSESEPAKVLVFLIIDEGKPLAEAR